MSLKKSGQLFLLPLFLFLTSCAVIPILGPMVSAVTEGATVYSSGKLSKVFDNSIKECLQASEQTFTKRDMPITAVYEKEESATIKSKYGDDKAVVITIEKIDKKMSQIFIRVGISGDEARSRHILGSIETELKDI